MNENNISGTLESVVINGSVFKIGGTNTPSESIGFEDQIEALNNSITAAKTAISTPSGEKYLNITKNTKSDGHDVYNIGTSGIDDAINTAIDTALSGNQSILETLNNITQWIENDTTGTASIIEALAGKADKVSNATSGNFASIGANGNLLDSGVSAASFQVAGNYKTTQQAVTNPTASGYTISFIDNISQNTNGVITATKKRVQTATDQQDGLMSAQDHSSLSALLNSDVVYNDVLYSVQVNDNMSGNIVIDGSKPVHVITLTGDADSVTLNTLPAEGHETRILFCSDQQRSVTITHNNTYRICPNAQDLSITVTPGGYTEVDFLRANDKVYVSSIYCSGTNGNTLGGEVTPVKSIVASSNNILLGPSGSPTGLYANHQEVTVKYSDNSLLANMTIEDHLTGGAIFTKDLHDATKIWIGSDEPNTSLEEDRDLGYITVSDGTDEINIYVTLMHDSYVDNNIYGWEFNWRPEHARFSSDEGLIVYIAEKNGYGSRQNVDIDLLYCYPTVLHDEKQFRKTVGGQELDAVYTYDEYGRVFTSNVNSANHAICGKIYLEIDNYSEDVVMVCRESEPHIIEVPTDRLGQHVRVTFHLEYSTTDKQHYHVKVTSPEGDYKERDIEINW